MLLIQDIFTQPLQRKCMTNYIGQAELYNQYSVLEQFSLGLNKEDSTYLETVFTQLNQLATDLATLDNTKMPTAASIDPEYPYKYLGLSKKLLNLQSIA